MDGGRGGIRGSLGSLVGAPRPGLALIRFTCDRPDHAKRSERYTLTIHDGKWAFWAHEGPRSDHNASAEMTSALPVWQQLLLHRIERLLRLLCRSATLVAVCERSDREARNCAG
jgi:hypothetical protein